MTLQRAGADRVAGACVAALAALALLDVGGLARMQHAAILVAAVGIAGLVVALRVHAR